MTNHNDLRQEAQQITDQIVSEYRPERVILFGSLANGTEHPNDIDLLVIKKTQERKIKRAQNLYRNLNWSYPLDIVVRTPQEVDKGLAQKNSFYINALKGNVLYDANHR